MHPVNYLHLKWCCHTGDSGELLGVLASKGSTITFSNTSTRETWWYCSTYGVVVVFFFFFFFLYLCGRGDHVKVPPPAAIHYFSPHIHTFLFSPSLLHFCSVHQGGDCLCEPTRKFDWQSTIQVQSSSSEPHAIGYRMHAYVTMVRVEWQAS